MNKGLISLLVGTGALVAPQLAYADDTQRDVIREECIIVHSIERNIVGGVLPTNSHSFRDTQGNKIEMTYEDPFKSYEVGDVLKFSYHKDPDLKFENGDTLSLIVNYDIKLVGKVDEEGRVPGGCYPTS